MHGSSRLILGHFFVVVVSAVWICTSYISSFLVGGGDSHGVIHPFLLTWLATSLFTLYLPIMQISNLMLGSKSKNHPTSRRQQANTDLPMNAALWSMPLWFLAQLAFNMSLARTSVTSNTIISSTSSLFTYFLAMLFLKEPFSIIKLLAIFATIAGTALVTLSDAEVDPGAKANQSVLGDMLVVLSAAFYGAYTVLMRVKMGSGEESERLVPYFFGYVGLFCTIFLAPVVVLFLSTGQMSLATVSGSTWLVILLEGLLDYVLSDYLWARAVIILGPTVATIGMSIQIPMAAALDFILGRAKWLGSTKTLLMTIGGTTLILAGFCVINLPATMIEKKDKKRMANEEGGHLRAEGSEREHEALLGGLEGGSEAGEVELSTSQTPSEIE